MMVADVDWGALSTVGSFVAGAVLGALAVLRVGAIVVEYFRGKDDG
jgi:hypothetical protein